MLETVPPETERVKEGLLDKKILGRNGVGRWEPRRAIVTKHMFLLAKPSSDEDKVVAPVLDCIPLEEIFDVVFVSGGAECDGVGSDAADGGDGAAGSSECAFNIVTVQGGHNGGRIFSVRASGTSEAQLWVDGYDRRLLQSNATNDTLPLEFLMCVCG